MKGVEYHHHWRRWNQCFFFAMTTIRPAETEPNLSADYQGFLPGDRDDLDIDASKTLFMLFYQTSENYSDIHLCDSSTDSVLHSSKKWPFGPNCTTNQYWQLCTASVQIFNHMCEAISLHFLHVLQYFTTQHLQTHSNMFIVFMFFVIKMRSLFYITLLIYLLQD